MTETNNIQPAENTQTAQTVAPPTLGIQDILNATSLIKVAMERGKAFTAEELVEISPIYARLLAFSKFVQEQAIAESQAKSAAEAEQTAEVPVAKKEKTKKSKK